MDRKEKAEIIQEVSERIDLKVVKFLIWYGPWIGSDIDYLVAVLKKKTNVRLCESSRLDILTINKNEFERRLWLFDPLFTEPLINGFLIKGDGVELGGLRSDIMLSKSLPVGTIQFLKDEARIRLENAAARWDIYKREKNRDVLLSYLIHLSWACSYLDFALYYSESSEFLPITLGHLMVLDGEPALRKVMEVLKKVKSGERCNEDKLVDLFEETQEWLKGG